MSHILIYVAHRIKILIIIYFLLFGCTPELYEDPYKPYISVSVDSIENATPENTDALYASIDIIEEVINSTQFHKELMRLEFTSTEHSNKEVYQMIVNGAELAKPDIDNKINLNVRFYYRDSHVLGMADQDTNRISLNTKFLNNSSFENNAATIMHEWLHNLGFDHVSSMDLNSVPYSVGYLVRKLARTYN